MIKVVHMHHHRPGRLAADIAAFGARDHAVCATPTTSKARYAAEYRVGVVMDADIVRLDGRPLAWADEQSARTGRYGTSGDSWMVPTPCRTLTLMGGQGEEYHADDGRGWCHDLAEFRPRDIVEVWVIPALSRIRAIKARADVPAETMAEARAVAAEMGLPFYIFPAPPPPPAPREWAPRIYVDEPGCRPARDDE